MTVVWGIILAAALSAPDPAHGIDATSETMDSEKGFHREVVRLHTVIEAWMAGSVPDSDEVFRGFSAAMADDFEIISPSGARSDRAAIVASFRGAHGVKEPPFKVAIKNLRTRLLQPPLALLTYEEWQFERDLTTARFSTVLLRDDPAAPGGVAWVHLQETWLPGLSPAGE